MVACLAPLATAHDWRTTLTADDFELGINKDPVTPVAGENVSFVAVMYHDNDSFEDQQTMQGSVVNATALITITTPSGQKTTKHATIPGDDPHFHFSHRFTESGDHTVQVQLAEKHGENSTDEHGHREVHDNSEQTTYHEIPPFNVPITVEEPNVAVKTSIAAEAVEQVQDDTAKTRSAVAEYEETLKDHQEILKSLQSTVNDQGATLARLKEKLEEQNSMIAFQRWTILASLLIILSVFIRDLTQG